MEVAPRQRAFFGGLKKAFKGFTKGIGSFLKSDIGKLALTAGSLYGLGGGTFFGKGLPGLASKGGFGFGNILSNVKNLGTVGKTIAGLGASQIFGGMEDQQLEELKSDPEALANYLRQYYSNLNKDAKPKEIEEFVQRNMQADGGRIGYDDGTNPKKDFLVKKGYGDMVKNMSVIEIDQLFNSVKGTFTDQGTYREPAYMGGRMGYAYGSDDLVEQASGIEGLDININPKGVKELDLRDSGGFIPPVGVKEKADDIPAMLSNNEFVFTADAVRAAGGGSANKGAQIMYDTMKKLENGGTV